jgi:glycosyltransferase involved in cell wall biosynthesis
MKLSIVVPVYNKSKFTANCLQNLYEVCSKIKHEILIMDDGSTDDTKEVVQQFVGTMQNIRYFKFENNVGVTKARNKGVEYAKGEYICVINNDVVFKPGHFEKLME